MTIGSHQRTVGASQSHFTPRWIIDRLGPFDLDPATAAPRPFDCARKNWTPAEDGLANQWRGFVRLNPPFDRYQVGAWVERMARHDNGIMLLHARTETDWFQPVWERATGILFLRQRLKFLRADGTAQSANSGAPVVLAAFGWQARTRLRAAGIAGRFVHHSIDLQSASERTGTQVEVA